MSARIFVFVAHPSETSLSSALSDAYISGVTSAGGATVRQQKLSEMQFDADLTDGYKKRKTLEPCLEQWRENLKWCSHFVWVSPMWWGTMPAKAKGVLDRALLPGFAFNYQETSPFPEKLLAGRTADVLITSDTPGWYNRFVLGNVYRKNITQYILGFCGIDTVTYRHFAVVKDATEDVVQKWLQLAESDGERGAKRVPAN